MLPVMAITHADLAPSHPSSTLAGRTGLYLMILTILCGLCCFILSLYAEATRSEIIWVDSGEKGKRQNYECVYDQSGRKPLLCGAAAFLMLAVGMVVEHSFVLVAVSKSPPPALVAWEPDSGFAKNLARLAVFFFLATWICFAIAEILLLVGLTGESGHLKNWTKPTTTCLAVREGIFTAAGALGLTTIFLAAGLYMTALRAQWLFQEQENVRREVLETTILHASPPASPIGRLFSFPPEDRVRQLVSEQPLAEYMAVFDKL